jgi:hypothetical protein
MTDKPGSGVWKPRTFNEHYKGEIMVGEKELLNLVETLKATRRISPDNRTCDSVYLALDAYLAKKKEAERDTITCPYCQTVTVLSKGTIEFKCACGVRFAKGNPLPLPLSPFGVNDVVDFRAVEKENRDTINAIIRYLAFHSMKGRD